MNEPTELSGSALAGAVAIKVMGWTYKNGLWLFSVEPPVKPMWFDGKERQYLYAADFRPDLNIAQAWAVKDRMIALGFDFDYEEEPVHGERPCAGFIANNGAWYASDTNGCVAICRGALSAVVNRI